MLPHAYGFVDPLFSTGIAWGLRAVERLALCFEQAARGSGRPSAAELSRYGDLLAKEADQIDWIVAGAYEAMAHFELFTAHAMIYFALVSFAEVRQRLRDDEASAWSGFLGVSDAVSEPLPRASLDRLRRITSGRGEPGHADERADYNPWVASAIAQRNVAGLADPSRHNLYPVDLDLLVERHALMGMTRDQLVAALPKLRGGVVEPIFATWP
jgi:FADH2 O2-dependent halogenase